MKDIGYIRINRLRKILVKPVDENLRIKSQNKHNFLEVLKNTYFIIRNNRTFYRKKTDLANSTKIEFMQNLQHDIRTPTATISILANRLFLNETDVYKKEMLSILDTSIKKVLDICNTIICFNNLDIIEKSHHNDHINIKKMAQDIIDINRSIIFIKPVTLHLNIDNYIPEKIKGNFFKTRSILSNLIENAIKFTHEGRISLFISVEKQSSTHITLKFDIIDTGIGIDENRLQTIFEKNTYFKINNQNHQSSGLGLYFVKKFIGELNGELKVESVLGKGTHFSILLSFILS